VLYKLLFNEGLGLGKKSLPFCMVDERMKKMSEIQLPCFVLILIMKANEMHYFSNLFDKVLYMFRTCPLSIIRNI